jgi:hypothetical protein
VETYSNHRRFVPLYHYVAGPILIANFVHAAWALRHGLSFESILWAATSFAFLLIAFYARAFALRVQDRVIRLEMRLRLRDLLPQDQRQAIDALTLRQMVGLRYASDAELPALFAEVVRTGEQNPDTIKKKIKNWTPDNARA